MTRGHLARKQTLGVDYIKGETSSVLSAQEFLGALPGPSSLGGPHLDIDLVSGPTETSGLADGLPTLPPSGVGDLNLRPGQRLAQRLGPSVLV